MNNDPSPRSGFTIVELLIVVVVIAILAAITIVSYNGVVGQANQAYVKADLSQIAKKLEIHRLTNGSYPSGDFQAAFNEIGYTGGDEVTYSYELSSSGYCIGAARGDYSFYISSSTGAPAEGECPTSLVYIQTVNKSNCPDSRQVAVDARDNRSYWVKELSDGQCWMLTNLAYEGGGDNTYGDVKSINYYESGTSSSDPRYYVPDDANPTSYPDEPSASTDGGSTDPQYGYHYNWCAAMGAQLSTSGCSSSTTPLPDVGVSICPAGWRLPTGQGTSGELALLNDAINNGSSNSDSGLLSGWLAQRGGHSFGEQGTKGTYWSSTQMSGTGVRMLDFTSSSVIDNNGGNKVYGFAVRCLAAA